ncbi:MAG: tRNA dihydrouridine synthase DusB [Bdellovibrionales bacterium]|nr:tRNA dihydrouridine synthase DusB [Bdellovibrionales bacterium]
MTSEQLRQHLKANPFILAPMAGITDQPFRTVMRRMKSGVVISELVSANGLKYGGDKTFKLMSYNHSERPVGIQLFGETPEVLAEAAKRVQDHGADFVDLNFGCPVKKVVSKGAGAALLKDLIQMRTVIRTAKSAITIPLTIKIRTGWDQTQRNAMDVLHLANDEGVTWVAIHGRTRSQGYSGLSDWDYISELAQKAPLPLIGNGDILTARQAVERLKQSQCAGVMIGRGCLKDPWIFWDALNLWNGVGEIPRKDHVQFFKELYEELVAYGEERYILIQLRKFGMWYSAGFPDSSQFRKELFSTRTAEETYASILAYYSKIDLNVKLDTSHEEFLMGGHG